MPTEKRIHQEEYLYLAGLSDTTALIAWGAFFFKVKKKNNREEWQIIDDEDLKKLDNPRKAILGMLSEPYAAKETLAEITLTNQTTGDKKTKSILGANHALFTELDPDTLYTYRVEVNGKEWGAGPLNDWAGDEEDGGMVPSGLSYRNEFRTFPDHRSPSPPVAFAVLGDPGRGVHRDGKDGCCQGVVAAELTKVVESKDVRFILTTGDNIYRSKTGTGREDDDWFFSYFQPYRHLINRVPVFPAVGNHDVGEAFFESNGDRTQLYDNLYIQAVFDDSTVASIDPGLFYRVQYGANIELISLDTSKKSIFFAERFFKHENHQPFLDSMFPAGPTKVWRIPFFHHPPFCAGPNHSNRESVIDHLLPRFKRSGVRAVFCGHEHNFQYALDEGISYFVTGGSGKFASDPPSRFDEAKTQAWGGNDEGHFLLVEINGDQMTVTPVGEMKEGKIRPIRVTSVVSTAGASPFTVRRS